MSQIRSNNLYQAEFATAESLYPQSPGMRNAYLAASGVPDIEIENRYPKSILYHIGYFAKNYWWVIVIIVLFHQWYLYNQRQKEKEEKLLSQ